MEQSATKKPVTKEEALIYKADALLNHIEKRKSNIKVLEEAVQKERDEIEREQEMIAIIKDHENGS